MHFHLTQTLTLRSILSLILNITRTVILHFSTVTLLIDPIHPGVFSNPHFTPGVCDGGYAGTSRIVSPPQTW